MPPKKKNESPAKEDAKEEMDDTDRRLGAIEAEIADMAARRSDSDAKLDKMDKLLSFMAGQMAGQQNMAAGGLGANAPSGGHENGVRPEVISNLTLRARGCREAAATMIHGLHHKHRTPEHKFDTYGKPENQGRKQTLPPAHRAL